MKIIANRQLCGDYGIAMPGQALEVSDEVGKQLIASGVAHEPPVVLYETKVIRPEVQTLAAEPFRDVSVPDAQPAAVAPEGDSVLEGADVPKQRVADRSQRRAPRGKGK